MTNADLKKKKTVFCLISLRKRIHLYSHKAPRDMPSHLHLTHNQTDQEFIPQSFQFKKCILCSMAPINSLLSYTKMGLIACKDFKVSKTLPIYILNWETQLCQPSDLEDRMCLLETNKDNNPQNPRPYTSVLLSKNHCLSFFEFEQHILMMGR